jgi:2-succinyl-5-enolpyruvyl-6-hydroxy-3-cyclohexene-1-carboxylate synthase
MGLSYAAVSNTLKRYAEADMQGLASGKRGRPVCFGHSLTAEQEDHVQRLIQEKRPEQLKMDFALWTPPAVMLLTERECGVKMGVRGVGKYLKRWLAEHDEQIEVFYLPSYPPELNPDERLNAGLKHAIATKVPMRTKAKLQSAAAQHMDQLTKIPERVKAFFRDPKVAYAA